MTEREKAVLAFIQACYADGTLREGMSTAALGVELTQAFARTAMAMLAKFKGAGVKQQFVTWLRGVADEVNRR